QQWTADPLTRSDGAVAVSSNQRQYGWLRRSSEDPFHNTIWFKYLHPDNRNALGGNQEPLVDTIEYVDVGTTHTRVIQFKYKARNPLIESVGYVAGLAFARTQSLVGIDIRVAKPGSQTPATVKYYDMTQERSAATGRVLLKSVRECDANPTTAATYACQRATTFSYQNGFLGFNDIPVPVADLRQDIDQDFWGIQPVDLDHDGLDDIVYRATPSGAPATEPPHWFVRLSTGNGLSDPIDLNLPEGNNRVTGDAVFADFFNDDGLPDIAVPADAAGGNTFVFYENQGVTSMGATFILRETEDPAPTKALAISDFGG